MKTLLFAIYLFAMGFAANAAENRLLYEDGVARELLIEGLKSKNIPFHVDTAGGVWYPAKDEKAVEGIAKGILKSRFGPSISFDDPVDMASFKTKLAAAGIAYQTKYQDRRERITWLPKDDKRVNEISDQVANESLERDNAARAKR